MATAQRISLPGVTVDFALIKVDHKERACAQCGRVQVAAISKADFVEYAHEWPAEIRDDVRKMMRCGRCQRIYYCNAACQRAHWKTHKARCFASASLVD